MGRPRKILTDAQLKEIELRAGAIGQSEERIAAALGISADTLARRKKDTPAVAAAFARGAALAEGEVGMALFKRAKSGDVPAIKWWEQTRAGRSEKQTHEHSGPNGGALDVIVTRRLVRPDPEPAT